MQVELTVTGIALMAAGLIVDEVCHRMPTKYIGVARRVAAWIAERIRKNARH